MTELLEKGNRLVGKYMSILTPIGLLAGVIFSDFFMQYTWLVPYMFAFVTFTGSLNSNYGDINRSVHRPVPIVLVFFIIHFFMPLFSCAFAYLLFGDYPMLLAGIIIAFAIPTGASCIMWISLYGGDVPLSLSAVVIDTILAPFIIPVILMVLIGAKVEINALKMIKDLSVMIAVPALCAVSVNQFSHGVVSTALTRRLGFFGKICVPIGLAINISKSGPYFKNLTPLLTGVFVTVLVLTVAGFLWGIVFSRLFKLPYESIISVSINSGLRSISVGAILALGYFSAETVFPIMVGSICQQTFIAVIFPKVLKYIKKHNVKAVTA